MLMSMLKAKTERPCTRWVLGRSVVLFVVSFVISFVISFVVSCLGLSERCLSACQLVWGGDNPECTRNRRESYCLRAARYCDAT